MKLVCLEKDGYAGLYGVPDNATEDLYEYGIYMGPPDLHGLGLPEEQLKILVADLVHNGLYNAPCLMGKRKQLLTLLRNNNIKTEILRNMLYIFQMDYYGEENE